MSPLLEWWHKSSYVLRKYHRKHHRKNLDSTAIWPPILVHPWFRPGYLLTGFTNDHIFSICFILQLKFLQMWDAAFGHWKLLWLFCWMCNLVYFLWRNRPNRTETASLLSFLDLTYPAGLLWTSDQPVAGAATYTANNKQKRKSMPSVGLESAIPTILRTYGHQDRRVYDYYN